MFCYEKNRHRICYGCYNYTTCTTYPKDLELYIETVIRLMRGG